jgi:hypothetical protein
MPLLRDAFTFREHDRRSEVSAEAEPGRKAGTDRGLTVDTTVTEGIPEGFHPARPSGSLWEVREQNVKASHFSPFPLEKSRRRFGEVLSYEFWVLSCLAQYWGVGEGLRGSVWLIWFVSFFWFVWFFAQGNQKDQRNQMNQRDKRVWSIWLRRSNRIWNLRFVVWPAGFRP